ncbi:unnamed protein product [Ascophyllum nodosum]
MAKHEKPTDGMECACCYDDIAEENYVEYRTGEGNDWLPSLFCEFCIMTLRKKQWPMYEESLAKATCKAQQKRMLGQGPPTHIYDKKALSCPEGESVHSLWFMRDGEIHSALLEGAPQGEARQIWWDDKLAFQFDEDDDEDGGGDQDPAADPTASEGAGTGTPVTEKRESASQLP